MSPDPREKRAITGEDIADLQRVLGPHWDETVEKRTEPPHVPDGLVGEVTDDKLRQLTDLVHARYVDEAGGMTLNLPNDVRVPLEQQFGDAATGEERLALLHRSLERFLVEVGAP